jgi:hypothetical protein
VPSSARAPSIGRHAQSRQRRQRKPYVSVTSASQRQNPSGELPSRGRLPASEGQASGIFGDLCLLLTPSASSGLNFRLARWMMAALITLILTGLLRGVRTHRALVLENLALRHQLAVLQRTARRPRLRRSDRVFWVLLSHLWRGWAETVSIVHPETVIRWHRTGFKLFWTCKSRRHGPGRPAIAPEVRALIRTMAHANPLWGAPRIHGELHKLGLSLGKDSPEPRQVERPDRGRIVETPMVGSLHHRYSRLAA